MLGAELLCNKGQFTRYVSRHIPLRCLMLTVNRETRRNALHRLIRPEFYSCVV